MTAIFWTSIGLLPLLLVVPARPDRDRRHASVADLWARHAARPRPITPRAVALAALAAAANGTWWAFLLAWPYLVGACVALWWALRLVGAIAAGLARLGVRLTPHALTLAAHVIKAAVWLLAALWLAVHWLAWHIDQLITDPAARPQLAIP
ncbi:hypothetical protein ACFWYW_56745 [Nonomuraea sp. NPDC059023]|uniref:hypothetical protein n=1 Tax=unclassified Nonomuraea TaxID=2593643 RepID=UPI003675C6C8